MYSHFRVLDFIVHDPYMYIISTGNSQGVFSGFQVTNDIAGRDMSNKGDSDTDPLKMLPQKTDTLRKFWYLNPKYTM